MNIYFELRGAAENKDGSPALAGVKVTIPGELKEGVTYQDAVQLIDKEGLLKVACLGGHFTADDVTFITEQEYTEEYGDDDDDD